MRKVIVLKGILCGIFLGCILSVHGQTGGYQIHPDTSILLHRGVYFRGQASISPSSNRWGLDGEVALRLAHPHFAGKQFRINLWLHPDSLIVPIKPAQALATGLYFSPHRRFLYNIWMEQPRAEEDIALTTAKGSLSYDPTEEAFVIGPEAKLRGQAYRGTTCGVDSAHVQFTTVSKIKLPMQPTDSKWQLELAGKWRENRTVNEMQSNLVARIALHKIPRKAWEQLADRARIVTATNQSISWNEPTLLQSIAEFKDPKPRKAPKNMDAFIAHLPSAHTYLDVGACANIDADLLLSGIEFRQDEEMHALWYAGEVGVIGIGGQEIGKQSSNNTKIEYLFGDAGTTDTLRIYLELDDQNWAYFEQYGENLHTISSDIDGYNTTVASRKRLQFVSGEADKDAYLNRFVNTYIWRTGRSRGGQ